MTDNRIIRLGGDDLSLEIWTIGARLNDIHIDGKRGILARAETAKEAMGAFKNHGAVVGPVANRLARAEAPIEGKVYQLEPNENGRTICHSGVKGVNTKIWSVDSISDTEATLSLEIADNADDFPGNRRLTTTYRLADGGFDVAFTATTDAATLVNLALHPYWSLNRTGRDGQRLMVNADGYLPIDADKIPTGEVAPVDGRIFDLRESRVPSTEIDHNFCLNASGPACVLSADNGLTVTIATDAPGLQVYTGNATGIAIEPQHWPDAPHHDNFPSILLQPDQVYRQTSRYRFSS